MNDMYTHDFDNGLKYLKCGLYGLLNNVEKRVDITGISINAIICAAEICDDIDICQSEFSKTILLRQKDSEYIFSIKPDNYSIIIEKFKAQKLI